MVFCSPLFAVKPASIEVDLHSYTEIPKERYFGVFIEFLEDYVNGPAGICAQEVIDRPFDVCGGNRRRGFSLRRCSKSRQN